MARKIVLAAAVILAALVIYNFATTGKLTLMPASSSSPEERQLEALEERVRAAGRDISGAGRAASVGGLDSTADVEAAMRRLERVEEEIAAVKKKATSEEVRQRCDRLVAESRSMRGAR